MSRLVYMLVCAHVRKLVIDSAIRTCYIHTAYQLFSSKERQARTKAGLSNPSSFKLKINAGALGGFIT